MAQILVIDDSPSQLSRLSSLLRAGGYANVSVAEDWAEVRAELEKAAPDVILLDINMPGMLSGDVLAAQLRKHPKCKTTKILFCSATVEKNLQAITTRAKADGYVLKSSIEETLIPAIRKFVAPDNAVAATPEASAGPAAPAAPHAPAARPSGAMPAASAQFRVAVAPVRKP